MAKPGKMPIQSFAGLSAEDIATRIEQDIRAEARKWRREHSKASARVAYGAATACAALYLQAHHELYFRDDKQDMLNAHQGWLELMREWFLQTIERREEPGSEVGQ